MGMTVPPAIRTIWSVEPRRDGEFPSVYSIGDCFDGRRDLIISAIRPRDHYLGDRAEVFYDVFAGAVLLASLSIRDVGGMTYVLPESV